MLPDGHYLMLQKISMDAMLAAVAFSCTDGLLQMVLLVYALVSAVVYVIVTFVGGIVPVKSLITFTMMVRVSTPILMIFFILNGWRYCSFRDTMDLALLVTWTLLLLTSVAYCLYDDLDITRKLWAKGDGVLFSQNDVLHIGLIFWMIYIATVVAHRVNDCAAPVFSG